MDEVELIRHFRVEAFQKALKSMHWEVATTQGTVRDHAIERHNRKSHLCGYKTMQEDYVLVAQMYGPRLKISTIRIECQRC